MLQSFDCVVVQVDVRDLHVVQIQALRIHGESMILCGNFDLLPLHIQNRMITTMMSEFQLVRSASKSEAEDLMPETNPEYRLQIGRAHV